MPSVAIVQSTEPRPQPAPAAPSRGTEPFSDLLDSAANARSGQDEAPPKQTKRSEPSAPPARGKSRAESVARGDTPGKACADETRGQDAPECVSGEQTVFSIEDGDAPEAGNADADAPKATTIATSVTGETEIAENVAATGITEVDTDTPVGDQETADNPDGEAEVAGTMPLEAIAVVKNVAPDAPVEIATTAVAPEGEAQIAPSNTPKATATPADAEAAPPTAVAAPQVATTKSAPTIVTDQSAEAEPVSLEPVQANNSRTANTNSTQTQTPQPAPTQPTATIPADAKSAATSDPDSQFPQQPTAPQADQLKPQQANASRPPEAPSLPAPTADASAPKIQINTAAPAVTPEPVRALAASLNPASLHAANVNEPNPVPLTGTALAVEIVSRMRDGLKRFDIRLDPPELGRVDVRLEVDRNGHATTRLTVDRPETLDLLQRDARGLERALQQAGLKTDQGGLEFTLRQQTNDAATDGRPGSSEPRPDLLAGDEVERIEAVIEGYRSAAHARGGVDIRI